MTLVWYEIEGLDLGPLGLPARDHLVRHGFREERVLPGGRELVRP